MAITTYSELKAAIASFLHRDDLTAEIDDFIDMAEADLQVRGRLGQWDTSATVTITSGSGPLPSDFAEAKAVRYSTAGTLQFAPLGGFDEMATAGTSGTPRYYTIRGSNLLVYPIYSGDVTLVYSARFTPLSGSATSNSLLTLFPDAYLYGSLAHACAWLQDRDNMIAYQAIANGAIERVRTYIEQYKFGNDLTVRVA